MKTIILNQKTKDTFIPSIGQVFYDKSNDVVLKCEKSKSGLCFGCWYFENRYVRSDSACLGNCQQSSSKDGNPTIYVQQKELKKLQKSNSKICWRKFLLILAHFSRFWHKSN